MNANSHRLPYQGRYPTIDALLEVHPDRELTDPEDCMRILEHSDMQEFILQEAQKRIDWRMNREDDRLSRADLEIAGGSAHEELLKAIMNLEKIQRYLERGNFTSKESGQATLRECVLFFARKLPGTILKRRISDRLRKLTTGKGGNSNAGQDGHFVEHENYDSDIHDKPPPKIEQFKMGLCMKEYLETATRIIAMIDAYREQLLMARLEKSSERKEAEIRALLDWKFGGFETADKAAQFHGANVRKVYQIWDNINRVRCGKKCQVHRWALKNHPELRDKINRQFEIWYKIEVLVGTDWNSNEDIEALVVSKLISPYRTT